MPTNKLSLKWSIAIVAFVCLGCAWIVLWLIPTIPEINSGDPIPRSGTLTDIAIVPGLKDKEYYQLALNIVSQNGWRVEDISLNSIGRTLSCRSIKSDLQIWIMLFRWRRVGLRWASDTGFVNLFPYRNEATYSLSESQGFVSNSLFHEAGIDLNEFQFDSRDAISLANKAVQNALPLAWDNECEIGVSDDKESEQPTWEVSYASKTSDVVFRLMVDGISGEVTWKQGPPSK